MMEHIEKRMLRHMLVIGKGLGKFVTPTGKQHIHNLKEQGMVWQDKRHIWHLTAKGREAAFAAAGEGE